VAFTWRDHTYHVTVIGHWHLRDRWWDVDKQSDRLYYRVQAPDLQAFELYRDTVSAGLWVLDSAPCGALAYSRHRRVDTREEV
jgi:hypothetical protein